VDSSKSASLSQGGQVSVVLLARHHPCADQHMRPHDRVLPAAALARRVPRSAAQLSLKLDDTRQRWMPRYTTALSGCGYNYDSTSIRFDWTGIRLPFDCNLTAFIRRLYWPGRNVGRRIVVNK